MTPEQLIAECKAQNPHLFKAPAGTGGGAAGGRSVVAGDTAPYAEQEAKVKALELEYQQTKSPRVLAAHARAVQELERIKRGAA